jgi:23S rRNA (uracil1939-C5)-methyltransferase
LTQSLRRAEPGLTGVLLSVHKERSNVILGQHLRLLWGRGELSDTLCGHEFSLSVPSFFQVNREQTEVLYARVLDFAALTGTETVLDLYCGVGTIALTLAKYAKHVIGGEIVPEAVANARENARGAGITNAEFFCGDAEKVAAELLRRGAAPHVIVTDPPRKGLAEGVIPVLARLNPAKIIYVSCDPGTLGRDVKRFAGEGYRASRAEACDLFPRTAHVETVVLLSKL